MRGLTLLGIIASALIATEVSAQNRAIVANQGASMVLVIDTDTQAVVASIPLAAPRDVAVTADGNTALISAPGAVHYLDLSVDPPTLRGSTAIADVDPFDISLASGCGNFAIVTGQFNISDTHIVSLDPQSMQALDSIAVVSPAQCSALVPDGNFLFAGALSASNLDAFTLSPTASLAGPTQSLATSGEPYNITVSPNGLRALAVQDPPVVGPANSLLVYDVVEGALSPVTAMALGGLASSVAYAPDGARAYVLRRATGNASLDVFTVDGNGDLTFLSALSVPEPTFGLRSGVDNVAVSPDSSRLCVSTRNVLSIFDTGTLSSLGSVPLTVAGGVAVYGPLPPALDTANLSLEAAACQVDQDPILPGVQAEFELWMRALPSEATSFHASLSYDVGQLMYEGLASSYSAAPFDAHFQAVLTAEVAPGELQLDGHALTLPGSDQDALLATLVFTVLSDCATVELDFDASADFDSELCFSGVAVTTQTIDSPAILSDGVAPAITQPADVLLAADAGVGDGCQSATLVFPDPLVTEACTSAALVCTPASGFAFPAGQTTTVTCTATDDCGNQSVATFDVSVAATNLVDVEIQLVGSGATTRCIHFSLPDCSSVDLALPFDASGLFVGTIEVPCGSWSSLIVKDEAHTLWSSVGLSLSMDGTRYVADAPILLDGGDADNDGDVDISEVTLLISQFGTLAPALSCPWDGTMSADFDNSGAVDSADYGFLIVNWLALSSSVCAATASPGPGAEIRISATASPLADKNGDGWIDWRDVELFERERGLSGELSRRIRSSDKR